MMENKFTPRAEEALRLAQEAAEDMGHGYVGSEHLLLGLLREEEGIAHRVLEENGLTDELVCDILHRSVGTGVSGAAPSQGLTPRAKSAVELAVSEAARTGAGYIGTEHLLMGLLREGNNMALRILRTVGIDPKKLYSAVVKKLNEAPRTAAVSGSASAPAQEGGKTLIQSAQLRNSIHAKSDASGFALGTNVKYAATHQFGEPGRTIRARKKKALRFQVGGKWVTKKQVRITIPARPFLGLSEDDMQEMKATVEEFIQKED